MAVCDERVEVMDLDSEPTQVATPRWSKLAVVAAVAFAVGVLGWNVWGHA